MPNHSPKRVLADAARYANSGSTRIFDGKVFKFETGSQKKSEAEAAAQRFRDQGHQARIVPWEVPLYQRASPKRRAAFESKDPRLVPTDPPRTYWCVYVRKIRKRRR